MKFLHDEGVVLRKHHSGEKDEVVVLFTKQQGKMAFLSKGSRDLKSRKAGALQLFNTVAFQANEGKGKLPYLRQVKSLRSRGFSLVSDASKNLDDFYRAAEILKLADQYLHELQSVQNVYNDLTLALDRVKMPTVFLVFWVRMLQDLGYIPDWSSCCICHEKLELSAALQFSTENKGFAHSLCCQKHSDTGNMSKLIDRDVIKVLVHWQRVGIDEALKVEVSEALQGEMRSLLEAIEIH